MQKILKNEATDKEKKLFAEMWQSRVKEIFNNVDKVIFVKRGVC